MDKESKNRILKILFENQKECDLNEINALFIANTAISEHKINQYLAIKENTHRLLIILRDSELVGERIDNRDIRNPIYYYRILPKGNKEFDSLSQKFWEFFTNDMGKILSIIATILSIIAIILSF